MTRQHIGTRRRTMNSGTRRPSGGITHINDRNGTIPIRGGIIYSLRNSRQHRRQTSRMRGTHSIIRQRGSNHHHTSSHRNGNNLFTIRLYKRTLNESTHTPRVRRNHHSHKRGRGSRHNGTRPNLSRSSNGIVLTNGSNHTRTSTVPDNTGTMPIEVSTDRAPTPGRVEPF